MVVFFTRPWPRFCFTVIYLISVNNVNTSLASQSCCPSTGPCQPAPTPDRQWWLNAIVATACHLIPAYRTMRTRRRSNKLGRQTRKAPHHPEISTCCQTETVTSRWPEREREKSVLLVESMSQQKWLEALFCSYPLEIFLKEKSKIDAVNLSWKSLKVWERICKSVDFGLLFFFFLGGGVGGEIALLQALAENFGCLCGAKWQQPLVQRCVILPWLMCMQCVCSLISA